MDFVVAGFGFGALVLLLGIGLRDLGPRVRGVRPGATLAWTDVEARLRWARGCRATGLVLALGAGGVCLMTAVALVAQVGDATGSVMVTASAFGSVLVSIGWAFAYAGHERRHWRPVRSAAPVPWDHVAPSDARRQTLSTPLPGTTEPVAPLVPPAGNALAPSPPVSQPRPDGRSPFTESQSPPIRSGATTETLPPGLSPLGEWSPVALRIMAGSTEKAALLDDGSDTIDGRLETDRTASTRRGSDQALGEPAASDGAAARAGRA